MLEEIGAIIRKKIIEQSIKAETLANEAGITDSYISKIVNNKLKTPPSISTLNKIAEALQLTTEEREKILKLAELAKTPATIREEYENMKRILSSSGFEINNQEIVKMPIYSGVSAGDGHLCYGEILYYDYFPVMRNLDAKFNIKVIGDSMEPMIPNGAVLTINEQSNLENGEIGVFIIDDKEGFVKKFYREDKFIRLVSLNPNYNDIIILPNEHFKIVGKVIKVSYTL